MKDSIREALSEVLEEGEVTELRVFTRTGALIGYFDDREALVNTVHMMSEEPDTKGVYYTPNKLPSELLARAPNKLIRARKGLGVRDRDVLEQRWLLVDVDPVRQGAANTKCSATDQEHAATLEVAQECARFLTNRGCPQPAVIDSGNGYHLMFRLEPLGDGSKARRTKCLQHTLLTLNKQFTTNYAEVDTRVYNPSRIWRVPSTWSRKSFTPEDDRPWRMSKMLVPPVGETPQQILEDISKEWEALSPNVKSVEGAVDVLAHKGTRPGRVRTADRPAAGSPPGPKELTTYLQEHCEDVQGPQEWRGGHRWIFPVCPWDSTHSDSSAAVVMQASGLITAKCHHTACAGHKRGAWFDLQDRYGELFSRSRRGRGMTTKKVPGLTDMGNAQQLSNLCGDDTRFIVDADRWYAYEKPVWIAGSDRAIYRTTTQVTGYWAQEAALEPDENKSKQIWKHMLRSEGAKSKYNMIQLASKLENLCARSSDFDSSPYLLNIKSGVMDLRTQKITPHAPSDMMMKLAPLTYVAGAKAPMWETFLARVQPNEEHRKCLQRFAGYWFTGLASEQVMLFMDGTGANGKSTFVNAIMAMLGSYAIVCPDNLLLATKSNEHPTGLADLQGSRFVSKMEIDKGKSFNEAMIKRLTGGERLKARWMRQDFFEFQPTHKICVGANHRPIIKGNDKGIWRRIPVIPFREEIPMDERVVDYENVMLRAEGPGIFNWVLEGLADFMNGGLQIPKSMWKETESYKLQMDVLGPFFEEACLLQEDTAPGTKIQVEQRVLYQAYVRWLKELSGKPCGYRHFNRLMRERNYENIVGWYRGKTRRVWKGIDILPLFDWGMEHPDLGSVVHTGHDALSEA